MNFNIQTAKRHRFAQHAETVGVPTDCVMMVTLFGDDSIMFFNYPDNTDIYMCAMRPDARGILSLTLGPQLQPGMWEQILADLDDINDDGGDHAG